MQVCKGTNKQQQQVIAKLSNKSYLKAVPTKNDYMQDMPKMSKFMARYTNFMQTYSIYGQTWPDKTKFLARSMQVFKYASASIK